MARAVSGERRLRTRSARRVEDVLNAFYALEPAEQLEVYAEAAAYLGAAAGPETRAASDARRKAAAVRDMRRAAEELKLAVDVAPTVRQYDMVQKELGLTSTRADIIGVFDTWDGAKGALTGAWRHETAAQRSLRARAQVARKSIDDHIETQREGLKFWLKSDPPPRFETAAAYDEFARQHNEASGDLHLVQSEAIRDTWEVYFADAVAVTKGAITLQQARQRRLADLAEASRGDLVLRVHAAEMLSMTVNQFKWAVQNERLAATSIVFSVNRRAWLREDIEAVAQGGRPPRRDGAELRRLYLTRAEVAAMLGVRRSTMQSYVWSEKWHLVPRPAARFSDWSYWRRRDVELWLRQRDSHQESD